jgi:dTDP-4-amino-4,6-dideoxygalactose transaminase
MSPADTSDALSTADRRREFLPFALPSVESDDVEEVVSVLRSGWLTSGPRIEKFEQEFAEQVRAPAALAMSSGTAAMHVALTALDLPAGKSVVVPSLTFCSTAHVIEHVGCRPLFVDVERDTLNIDPAAVRRAIAAHPDGPEGIAAIMPVHYAGHPVELDAILDIAREYGLPVVEDAAHAFGAAFRGTPIGEVPGGEDSRAVAFSLYATKNITCGEGGVLTGSAALVKRSRLWTLHGMSRDSWERYGPRGSWEYEVLVPGFKYNMADIQAAFAQSQLRRWRSLQHRRTEIANRYTELFADTDEVQTPIAREHVTHAWHLYPIRLRLDRLSIDRRHFIEELKARNIGTSVHFIPLHLQPYYRERYQHERDDFPVTAAEFDRLISLPIYPRMSDADVDDVVAAVHDVVRTHGGEDRRASQRARSGTGPDPTIKTDENGEM